MADHASNRFATQFRRCAEDLVQHGVAALGELHDLAAPRLVRYAMTLTQNQADAEDALQASFLQVARHPRKLASAALPWPYLLRIIRNESIKLMRKRRTHAVIAEGDAVVISPPVGNDRQAMAEVVQQAMRRLPPAQAEVVALKIWENMTFAEIGAVLGESPNTAASRYRYALEKLTEHLRILNPEADHVV